MTILCNPGTYEEAIRELAAAHAEDAAADLRIYLFPDVQHKTVRFLEISKDHPSELPEARRVPAFHFMPASDFAYHSEVILLSLDDETRLKNGNLALPEGWDLTMAKQVWPE